MKKNKSGFTIVELVIVIAVIAILAAVMIPTFTGIVEKAQKSAALQEARAMMTEYIAYKDANPPAKYYIKVENYYFAVENGQIDDEVLSVGQVPNGETIISADGADDNLFPDETVQSNPYAGQ